MGTQPLLLTPLLITHVAIAVINQPCINLDDKYASMLNFNAV